jgi:hypothetical protein
VKKRERAARHPNSLKVENERLREALGLGGAITEEVWGAFAPQKVRDQMAAAALVHSRLNYWDALRRLGFDVTLDENGRMSKEQKETATKVFGTPGVQAIMEQMTETEIAKNADNYVKRLNQIAISDDDGEANRAIQSLARLGGLNKEKPITQIDSRSVNLFLLGQKGATRDSLAGGPKELEASEFLTHEPGDAQRIFEVAEGEA